jgi:hypothetical protein
MKPIEELRRIASGNFPSEWAIGETFVDDFDLKSIMIGPRYEEKEDKEGTLWAFSPEDGILSVDAIEWDTEAIARFVRTFDPATVEQLLDRVEKAEQQLSEYVSRDYY